MPPVKNQKKPVAGNPVITTSSYLRRNVAGGMCKNLIAGMASEQQVSLALQKHLQENFPICAQYGK